MSVIMFLIGIIELVIAFMANANKGDYIGLTDIDILGTIHKMVDSDPWDFSKYKYILVEYGAANTIELLVAGFILVVSGILLFIHKHKLPGSDIYFGSKYIVRLCALVFVPIVYTAIAAKVICFYALDSFNVFKIVWWWFFNDSIDVSRADTSMAAGIIIATYISCFFSMTIWRRYPTKRSVISFIVYMLLAVAVTVLIYKFIGAIFFYLLTLIELALIIAVLWIVGKILGWFGDTKLGQGIEKAIVTADKLVKEFEASDIEVKLEQKSRISSSDLDFLLNRIDEGYKVSYKTEQWLRDKGYYL